MAEKTRFIDLPFEKQDQSKTVQFTVKPECGLVICKLYDREYNTYHRGKARCDNADKFDERIGRTIAFNKARKKELAYNLRMINEETADLENAYVIYKHRLDKRKNKCVNDYAAIKKEETDLLK